MPTATAAPYSSSNTSVQAAKAALRRHMRALRATQAPALADRVRSNLLARHWPQAVTIAGVWPLPGEIDLRPVLHALHAAGHAIVLPETPPRGQPLRFRRWHPAATMIRERFGTFRPDGEDATPDILLVPLLAFDGARTRLGYGGGYYDRTLAALPGVPAIGFGYSAQYVEAVPREPHDRPLDEVVTDA